jgi:hypothetical protein
LPGWPSPRRGEVLDAEQVVRVGPDLADAEAGGGGERGKLFARVLVGALAADRLAVAEFDGEVAEADGLVAAADEVHLDAVVEGVVDRSVAEAGDVEVAAELAVDAGRGG